MKMREEIALGRWKELLQRMVKRCKVAVEHSSSWKDPKQLEISGKMDQILNLLTSVICHTQKSEQPLQPSLTKANLWPAEGSTKKGKQQMQV